MSFSSSGLTLFESKFLNIKIREHRGIRCQSMRRSSFFSSSGLKSSRACVRSSSKSSSPDLEVLSPAAGPTLSSLASTSSSEVEAARCEVVISVAATRGCSKQNGSTLSESWKPYQSFYARYLSQIVDTWPFPAADRTWKHKSPCTKHSISATDHETASERFLDNGSGTMELLLSHPM